MSSNQYVAPFYLPPTAAQYSGLIELGQIVLYKDAIWTSVSLTIDTGGSQYPEGYAFSFSGTPLGGTASWIAFLLPAGTVCTLFQYPAAASDNPYNFAGAGVCIDLIGNGKVQTVDLIAYGANDCLTGGIWRQVALNQGWFQLFRDGGCSGPFNTLFLHEWPTGIPYSFAGWAARFSSINYPCLTPPQILTLLSNADGSGQQIALGASYAFGTLPKQSERVTLDFDQRGLNDAIHSFEYDVLQPVKAAIDSVTTNYDVLPIPQGQTIEETIGGQNTTSEPTLIALQLAESRSCTITAETTLQYSISATVSATVTVSEGVPDVASTSCSVTTSFTAEASEKTYRSYSETTTLQLGQEITFTAPANSKYEATARVSWAPLPPTTVTTTGQFYYQQKLPGAVQDSQSKLWRLDGPIAVTLGGAVGTQITFDASSTPIEPG